MQKIARHADEWKIQRNPRPRCLKRNWLSNQLPRANRLLEQHRYRYEAPWLYSRNFILLKWHRQNCGGHQKNVQNTGHKVRAGWFAWGSKHLRAFNNNQKEKLHLLLSQHEPLFDGTLGKWEGNPYHMELCKGAKPYHATLYSLPHVYERTLCMEVNRLCKVGSYKK